MNRDFRSPVRTTRALVLAGMLGLVGNAIAQTANTSYPGVQGAAIQVQGLEAGAHTDKIIVNLQGTATGASAEGASVIMEGVTREVDEVYPSDARGNRQSSGRYLTVDMKMLFVPGGYPPSALHYNTTTLLNEWTGQMQVDLQIPSVTIDQVPYRLTLQQNLGGNFVAEDAERFGVRRAFSGTYNNLMTGQPERQTLNMAAYQPSSLAGGARNPLIVWLHGQREGGTNPDMMLVSNEAVALAKSPIQNHFEAGGQRGAYVLMPQAPTHWMDEGDGTIRDGTGRSRYTEILMDAILDYVASNPDVDPNRIYIGGLSMGAFMTMELITNYPYYFAAAIPVCGPYPYFNPEQGNRWFTDEKAQSIRHLPIWFVHSNDDPVVNEAETSLPTYQALLKAGAQNAWYSYFENVRGSDHPGAEYFGHVVWVYVFNDEVTGVQNPQTIMNATDTETYGATPSNAARGGSQRATVSGTQYEGLFQWLNAQAKR